MQKNYFLALILCVLVSAKNFSQETIIKTPNTSEVGFDSFGNDTSTFENRILVGAMSTKKSGVPSGTAYVFKNEGEHWKLEQELLQNDPNQDDSFGWRVAMHKTTAVVSSPKNDQKGAVYVYEYFDNKWNFVKKLIGSDTEINGNFGYRLSMNNEKSFIVSNFTDGIPTTEHKNFAYVFEKVDGDWIETQKLTTSNIATKGLTLKYKDNLILLGDRSYSNTSATGIVYTFEKQKEKWIEVQNIVPDITLTSFGFSIDYDGTSLAISSINSSPRIYKKNKTTNKWELFSEIPLPSPAIANYGFSISIKDNLFLLGSDNNQVLVYKKDPTNNWSQIDTLKPSQSDSFLTYGFWDINMNSKYITIGSLYKVDTTPTSDLGGVFIYETDKTFGSEPSKDISFSVYPNPSKGNLTITTNDQSDSINVSIYNYMGQEVRAYTKLVTNNKVYIDNLNLSKGIYFIKIFNKETKSYSSKKIILR